MHSSTSSRASIRRTGAVLVVLTVLTGAISATAAILADQPSSASTALSASPSLRGADGDVTSDVTVFDGGYAAVAKLDPALLAALQHAAAEASADGVTFFVNSGWRSPEYQGELLREAVAQYGSAAEAARWVATAETSPHVQGDAVDIGEWDAAGWLSAHGARYGLCQIYMNEPWHYELRPTTEQDGCPAMYPDPTYDPRMQR